VANTITLGTNVTAAAGDSICLAGSFNKELTGIKDVMTLDTTLYGVDRSTRKFFNPIVLDKTVASAPAPFDPLWLADAKQKVMNRSGDVPKFFVCSDGVELAYVNEENFYKRNIETMKLDGGYDVLTYQGIPVVTDMYFPKNSMALLTLDNWKMAQLGEWDWLNRDGGTELYMVPGKPIWGAAMIKFCELLCEKPGGNALITGIEEYAA
jgi:hypothetical protein